ncbi:MAG: allantoinase AllB [Clostridiales bacterium]|nr:allantoinase AllB [Clostridiales bacterium]
MYDLLVKNGKIVNEDSCFKGNLYVRGEKIAALTLCDEIYDAKRVIDAEGKLIFPGAVDAHMHIGERDADFEDVKTSTMAAAAGGVTTCIDMPLNLYSPSVLTGDGVMLKKELLKNQSYVDFCMWGGFTPESLPHIEEMHKTGVISFKAFLSGGGNDFYAPNLGEVRQGLMTIKKFNGLAGFHCEDFSIVNYEKERLLKENPPKSRGRQAFLNSRPLSCEIIAVRSIIELAEETGARVHICHVSHPKVAEIIEEAQLRGVDITAETCTHYLTFTEKDYLEKGCAFGCAPPLRDEKSREGLWEYVKKGVLSCVVSDHSPGVKENRSDEDKPAYKSGYGISGVQTMLPVFYDGAVNKRGCTPELIARELSANPAKRWGIYGRKGAVKVGFDADFVIFDSNKEWIIDENKLFYKVKLTAFNGLKLKGAVEKTFIRGTAVFEDGEIKVSEKFGRLVK